MRYAELRFLVVEDHDFQRRMLSQMLRGFGALSVHSAADGGAALEITRDPERPIDIVISDLEMPGMDGMEFIRHLGEAGARVSLILASALDRKLIASIATMAEAYGMTLLGVAEKPLTKTKLDALLRLHWGIDNPAPYVPTSVVEFGIDEIAAGLRNDEFAPWFQPKVEIATRRVRGVEALARWQHPQRGLVSPFAFVPVLEEKNQMDDLTWLILRKTANALTRWQAAGFDGTVAVNLSIKSLSSPDLCERVSRIVDEQRLDPRCFMLEVTESAATSDLARVLENLARLRVRGFGLSIDDFGTGYSSMQQLSRVAFTELKIDRTFVANAAREESARIILSSSLDIARRLGLTAVAEGVETQAEWDLLSKLGCELAQGYWIARPMEAETLPGWIADWERGVDSSSGKSRQ